MAIIIIIMVIMITMVSVIIMSVIIIKKCPQYNSFKPDAEVNAMSSFLLNML